jgi:cysteine desulfurase
MYFNETVYCDYQATTPVDPAVAKVICKVLQNEFGNPHSSDHILGWNAANRVEHAKSLIAELLNIFENEIIFTSGATESNNLAILGYALGNFCKNKTIAVSKIEHKSVLEVAHTLKEHHGWKIVYLEVENDGLVNLDSLEKALSNGASIVSVMAVNNEIGTIQPIKKIATLAHSSGAFFHCDAAQAIGSGINFESIINYSDSVSISGHKIYGPKGIGLLILNEKFYEKILPIFWGGNQQNGLRPGTLPVHQIVGIAEAIRISFYNSKKELNRVASLRDEFYNLLANEDVKIVLNGPQLKNRHVGNLNIRFHEVDNRELMGMLQPYVAASTGSACTSGLPHPSHVLISIGLTSEEANNSVRFSFGRFTTVKQIVEVKNRLITALNELK